jgi:hypothetical protein
MVFARCTRDSEVKLYLAVYLEAIYERTCPGYRITT